MIGWDVHALRSVQASLQGQVDISNHFFFFYTRPHVDVVKNHGEITKHFTTLRQPDFVKIGSRLIVKTRPDISCVSASQVRNCLCLNPVRIRANIFFDRQAKVDTMFNWRCVEWIGIVNSVATVFLPTASYSRAGEPRCSMKATFVSGKVTILTSICNSSCFAAQRQVQW